jgi:hypothetical protein
MSVGLPNYALQWMLRYWAALALALSSTTKLETVRLLEFYGIFDHRMNKAIAAGVFTPSHEQAVISVTT